jgi:hypothetical protein
MYLRIFQRVSMNLQKNLAFCRKIRTFCRKILPQYIKPGMREEYEQDKYNYLPSESNESHPTFQVDGMKFTWSHPKDLFFSKKRPIFFIKMQEFSISLQYARGHPATFRGDFQPSAGSLAGISSREQSLRAECASHGARLQRPGPQNGPAL